MTFNGVNPFNPAYAVNPAGGGTYGVGSPYAGGRSAGISGSSAVAQDIANMRSYLPQYNGTGELRPNNDEEGSTLKNLYA